MLVAINSRYRVSPPSCLFLTFLCLPAIFACLHYRHFFCLCHAFFSYLRLFDDIYAAAPRCRSHYSSFTIFHVALRYALFTATPLRHAAFSLMLMLLDAALRAAVI